MTPDLLRDAVGCTAERAEQFAEPLTEACAKFGISTVMRLAMFLANVAHETRGLLWLGEIWGPTDAQKRYEGRADLGNTQPGDGFRFRGRGVLQTTGRSNYRELRPAFILAGYEDVPDFEAEPDRLVDPRWASASAGHYWASRKINALADAGNFEGVVRKINGGLNGLADRIACLNRAQKAIDDHLGKIDWATVPSGQLSANISNPVVGAVESDSTPAPAPTAPEPTWHMPAGEGDAPEFASQPPELVAESPELAPPSAAEGKPMSFGDVIKNPATAGLLSLVNPLLGLVPQVAQIFMNKEGTTVPERNVAVAVAVADAAQKALKEAGKPAENMQQVVETIGADPEARDIAKQGVMADCLHLVESGGGGIEGARKADTAFLAPDAKGFWHSPAFWISVLLMAYPTMLLVDVFYVHPEAYKGDIRTQIVTGVLGVIMMVGGYWIGTSFSSSKKDERASR